MRKWFNRRLCIGGLALAVSPLVSLPAHSQEEPRSAVVANCDDLNYQIKREGSPYHYSNPNEGCGISLQLDGLPTKTGSGYSTSGNDACGAIQGVVGDLQGRLNERLQGALSEIGDVVSADELDELAAQAGVDASPLTNVMRDGVNVGGVLNSSATETLGGLTTSEGRERMKDEIKESAGQRAQESLQNVGSGQVGGSGTPGINGGDSGETESDWSIFD